jgi:hypothetical protein
MATTFELIAFTEVGSGGAANIDFNVIPATFTDLVLKISGRSSRSGIAYDDLNIAFNNSTASFSGIAIQGAGSGTPGSFGVNNFLGQLDTTVNTASTFTSVDVYIPKYVGSANKSYSVDSVQEQNGTTAYSNLVAGLWSVGSTINRITLTAASGNLVQYSSAYLYGVKNA